MEWRQHTFKGTSQPKERWGATTLVINNSVYIIGGYCGTHSPEFLNDVWDLNFENQTATQLNI